MFFIFRKIVKTFTNSIDIFCFFLQKDLYKVQEYVKTFVFSSSDRPWYLWQALFWSLCFFYNIQLTFLYMGKTIWKHILKYINVWSVFKVFFRNITLPYYHINTIKILCNVYFCSPHNLHNYDLDKSYYKLYKLCKS